MAFTETQKARLAQIKQNLNDACWEYTEAYSLQSEKSDLIETNLSAVGELIQEEQHDWLWLLDSEERAADIKAQIKNIRSCQTALCNVLNWVDPGEIKEIAKANARVNVLKEQLKDTAQYCDKRAADQREMETFEHNQEHPALHTLRFAIAKAKHGHMDKGYWNWAKKLVAYSRTAADSKQISVTASKKIKLGAYMLMDQVAKNNQWTDCEWIAERVEYLQAKLEEWNEQFDIKEEIPSSEFGQRYGLSVSELEWAIDASRQRGRFVQYTRNFKDDEFFDEIASEEQAQEEATNGWASCLVDLMF